MPATYATEHVLYNATTEYLRRYPEDAVVLSTFIEEDDQYVVRLSGPVMATIGAVLCTVHALRQMLRENPDNEFCLAVRKQFPKSAKMVLSGGSYVDATGALILQHNAIMDSGRDDIDAGIPMSAVEEADPVPLAAHAIGAVLRGTSSISPNGEPVPLSCAYGVCTNSGDCSLGYVGGWPAQAAAAVLSLLSALMEYIERCIDEAPMWIPLRSLLYRMVRDTWREGNVEMVLDAAWTVVSEEADDNNRRGRKR